MWKASCPASSFSTTPTSKELADVERASASDAVGPTLSTWLLSRSSSPYFSLPSPLHQNLSVHTMHLVASLADLCMSVYCNAYTSESFILELLVMFLWDDTWPPWSYNLGPADGSLMMMGVVCLKDGLWHPVSAAPSLAGAWHTVSVLLSHWPGVASCVSAALSLAGAWHPVSVLLCHWLGMTVQCQCCSVISWVWQSSGLMSASPDHDSYTQTRWCNTNMHTFTILPFCSVFIMVAVRGTFWHC